jgi:pyrroloquinoline quinone biosynthesis protein B
VAGGAEWALVNASPDILAQLQSNPDLQPARAVRHASIAINILVDASGSETM